MNDNKDADNPTVVVSVGRMFAMQYLVSTVLAPTCVFVLVYLLVEDVWVAAGVAFAVLAVFCLGATYALRKRTHVGRQLLAWWNRSEPR